MKAIDKQKISDFYNKYYKRVLILPFLLFLFSITYMVIFYNATGDFIKKDISLTGGTSIQVNTQMSIKELYDSLSPKFKDVSIRQVSDILTGEQVALIIETRSNPEEIKPVLESILGFSLNSENSTIEFTGSTIGEGFYFQLILAIIIAFTFMATVVFFIFSTNKKLKFLSVILSLLTPLFFFFIKILSINQAILLSLISLLLILLFSLKSSIPALAVITCAFADLFFTVTIVNLIGMEVSTAGIVAFLMLIGYSVDTDILLTTRVLKRREGSVNSRIFNSFKTGILMTITSLAVVAIGLILTSSFSSVLNQIFLILFIGLIVDIFNTWVTNTSIIKWFVEKEKLY
ncbi:MAG: hypothetical protein QXJ28_01685 [Candidatus Pacearchaeota archaeon]